MNLENRVTNFDILNFILTSTYTWHTCTKWYS